MFNVFDLQVALRTKVGKFGVGALLELNGVILEVGGRLHEGLQLVEDRLVSIGQSL